MTGITISLIVLLTTRAAAATISPSHSCCPPDSAAEHPAPSPALGALRPILGTTHYQMLQRPAGDSVFHPFGLVIVNRSAELMGATAVLRNIAHYDWSNGKATTDTTVSLVQTLAPISERTHTPSRIVSYDFHYLYSTGKIGPDSSLKTIDDTLPRPAFNSTDLDMLVTALPLSASFHAVLPLYDPEFPGFRMAELKVTGKESIRTSCGERHAWLLAFNEPARNTMYYRVDEKTHAVLQKDFVSTAGPSFQIKATCGD